MTIYTIIDIFMEYGFHVALIIFLLWRDKARDLQHRKEMREITINYREVLIQNIEAIQNLKSLIKERIK